MKNKLLFGFLFSFLFFSCDESFEDLNYNRNAITTDEVIPADLLIKGTMLANISINLSHLQRISGMWSGQYRGEISSYLGLYNYDISASESNSAWQYLYNGILKQNREIAKYYTINGIDAKGKLILAISKVIEANAVGTGASIWGDMPYKEAISDDVFFDPKFDKQSDVYKSMQFLLDEAIAILNDATTANFLDEDIFFAGEKLKWKETAYTLKARYYLHTKQYNLAYQNAEKGISTFQNTMKFTPTEVFGTENLLYRFLVGGNRGYMTVDNTFCRDLLSIDSPKTRRNAKTNEASRRNYLRAGHFFRTGSNSYIHGELTPMNLVSYQENELILAETGARTISMDEGLKHLNVVRAFNLTEDAFIRSSTRKYDAYVLTDFDAGDIENEDNIAPERALLREIIEERYVSGFGTFMPWNDLRRLRKSDSDLMVPVPFNTTTVTMHPQRFIISQNEINSNPNAPSNLTIFDPTEVNQ